MPPVTLKLGKQTITPPLMLAPMMDVTNQAFRALVRYYGGCGLFFTEMLNSRRIPNESPKSPLWKGLGIEQDVMVQLLGDDVNALVRSMEKILPLNPFGFDWNLGCSKRKIMCWGWGADLLDHPIKVAKVLNAMRNVTDRPLTVKIRIPDEFEPATFLKFIKVFEQEGVDAVTVHARTPKDGFKRPARWEKINWVKENLRIPVIGNGDVISAESAREMFKQTGCDGVMIGRAAISRPYLFRDSVNLLANATALPEPQPVEVLEKMLEYLEPYLDTHKGAEELKTFCQYFALVLPVPHWFWGPLQSVYDGRELAKRALAYFRK